jgi:K+-transporting ATPase KdpF subunit
VPPPPYDSGMSIELIIAGVLGVILLVYLVYSIIRPERF